MDGVDWLVAILAATLLNPSSGMEMMKLAANDGAMVVASGSTTSGTPVKNVRITCQVGEGL